MNYCGGNLLEEILKKIKVRETNEGYNDEVEEHGKGGV